MDDNPVILDAAVLAGAVGNGKIRRTRHVIFEFTGAATLAYVPNNPCHIISVCIGSVDIAFALSTSAFPAAIPNGGTSRVIDYLIYGNSALGASIERPMNVKVEVNPGVIATIYAKKYSAGGGVGCVTLAFDDPDIKDQRQ